MFRRTRCFLAAFDPFAVLGLPATASRDEVKQRYREMALRYHPDSGTDANQNKMEDINRAYNMLVKEGMVDQLRREHSAASASGSATTSAPTFEDDDNAATSATLDPTTERISEDGTHFMYLCRETGRWVHRHTPLTRPRQPRYATFTQAKQDVDLHDEIRRKSTEQQKKEEVRSGTADKYMRNVRDALPFENVPLAILALCVYAFGGYQMYHRALDKKLVWDDKRAFFYDKRWHREAIEKDYETFEPECNIAAEAALLIFVAAALKTQEADEVQPPTPSEAGTRAPYYYYAIYNQS